MLHPMADDDHGLNRHVHRETGGDLWSGPERQGPKAPSPFGDPHPAPIGGRRSRAGAGHGSWVMGMVPCRGPAALPRHQGSPAPSIHAMGGPLRRQRSGKGPVVSVPTLRRGTRRRPVEVRLRHRDAHARGRVEIRSSPRPISGVSEHNLWA